jgi:hypothetical protein
MKTAAIILKYFLKEQDMSVWTGRFSSEIFEHDNEPSSPVKVKVSKAITVTGRGGPYGCEILRVPHFLDNRLTDGCKVVSPTRRLPFTPRNIPGTHFC